MFPDLFTITRNYWHQLDEIEAAYQQNKISLKEVDRRVAQAMAELGRERRAVFNYLWSSWQRWLTTHRETVIGLTALALITSAWVLTLSVS
jgi:hypothetical protein